MQPPLIIQQARRLGIGLLAVTDHNSAENAGAMIEAGRREDITVLPGMEVQTREEVHLVCLFNMLEQALVWQEQVYERLPPLQNREEVFGSQLIVDSEGDFVGYNHRLLLTSTAFSVEEVFQAVHCLGGLVIPAHIDRAAFGLIATLGMVPETIDLPAAEVTARASLEEVRRRNPELEGVTLIRSGDAHRLSELSNRTMLRLERPCVEELRLAFAGQCGRKVIVD